MSNQNQTISILQHTIAWWLRGESAPNELDDCSREHIEAKLNEGYIQGELCVIGDDGDSEFRGGWNIQRDDTTSALADHESLTRIAAHDIAWNLFAADAPTELDETSEQHIQTCLADGYVEGELCVIGDDGETEYRGWWRIL